MKIRPINGRVLVKPLEAAGKTAGGIHLPDSAKEKPQEGEVVGATGTNGGAVAWREKGTGKGTETPPKTSHQTARVCNETEEVASARNNVTKPTNVDSMPVETGSGGGIRTPDTRIMIPLLSPLSYPAREEVWLIREHRLQSSPRMPP